jgi:hypothetical protein
LVVEQIRRGFVEEGTWDPVPAAVELLAIGARLLGEPASGGRLLENQVAALFAPAEAVEKIDRGPLWRNLLQGFLRNRPQLIELVVSRAAATKGGSTRVQVLDASQYIVPLRAVQEEWLPRQTLPEKIPRTGEYEALRKLQEKFREGLDGAIDEERTRVLARYARVAKALAWEDGIKEVAPVVRDAKRRAQEEGVFSGTSPEELDRVISAVNKAPLIRWQTAVETIAQAADDRGILLAELGQDLEAAARPAEEFVTMAESFLKSSTDKVRRQVEDLEQAGGRDLEASYEQIQDHFRKLDDLVERLGKVETLMSVPVAGAQP